jgi:hypothetical protein
MNERVQKSISRANTRRFRDKTAKSLVTEAHVQQTCVEFLQLDGWRAFRTEMTVQREYGRAVGEVGQPDYLFIRYKYPCKGEGCSGETCGTAECATAEVLWIEFKAPGKNADAHQLDWHRAEQARGALVLVVDDIDGFIAWYKSSGLGRRV